MHSIGKSKKQTLFQAVRKNDWVRRISTMQIFPRAHFFDESSGLRSSVDRCRVLGRSSCRRRPAGGVVDCRASGGAGDLDRMGRGIGARFGRKGGRRGGD